MIVNGKVVLDSEIWVNLLTPESIAASERAYQSQLREERRRIDAKFAHIDARQARSGSSPKKIYRNRPVQIMKTNLAARAFQEQVELAELELNQTRLLHFILE